MNLIEAIDARFEKVIEHIDNAMHAMTEHLGEAFGNFLSFLGGAAVKGGSVAIQKMDSVADRVSSATVPSISQAKAVAKPEKTPQISQELIATAKQATMSMNGHAVTPQSSQYEVHDVASHNFSPSATPSIGFGAASMGMAV